MRLGVAVITAFAAGLALTGSTSASLEVADDVQRPALRVDVRGWAEVSLPATRRRRLGGVATRAHRPFVRFVAGGAPRYRAVLPGPNIGSVWAPDAASPAVAPRR